MNVHEIAPTSVVYVDTAPNGPDSTFEYGYVLYTMFNRVLAYFPGTNPSAPASPEIPDTIRVVEGQHIAGVYKLTEVPAEWTAAAWEGARQAPGCLGDRTVIRALETASVMAGIVLDDHAKRQTR